MAIIKLGQFLHKDAVGSVTNVNPLDTDDVNSTNYLTALGLVAQDTTLVALATDIDTIKTLLQQAMVDV